MDSYIFEIYFAISTLIHVSYIIVLLVKILLIIIEASNPDLNLVNLEVSS